MGIVYKGEDPVIHRAVAIKTLAPQYQGPEHHELQERFKHEAQAAGRLNHPNIINVYEYGEDAGTAYLATEFVDGKTLSEIEDTDQVFSPREVAEIVLNVLNALAYAHQNGVVHRDIKPSNIMLSSSGEVKIADFGIARIESSELTQMGTVMGTPGYMSPEQLLGEQVDQRSDLFSTGVLLYELLIRKPAFRGTNIASTAFQVVHTELQPISEIDPNISDVIDSVISKALAKKPDDRYADAQAFAADLSACLPALSSTASAQSKLVSNDATVIQTPPSHLVSPEKSPETPASPPQSNQRKSSKGIWLGLIAIAAIGGGGFWGKKMLDSGEPKPVRQQVTSPTVKPQTQDLASAAETVDAQTEQPGDTIQDCPYCPQLIVVPSGSFLKGSPDSELGRLSNEGPQHQVDINYQFAVSKFEISKLEYSIFVSDSNYQSNGCWVYDGEWIERPDHGWQKPGFEQDDTHPATCISWDDAKAYINWLTQKTGHDYRLLSAAEWEFLARTGSDNPSCTVANLADQTAAQAYPGWTVHSCTDGFVNTAPTSAFQANELGIYGLSGNVFEWVEDCWNQTYQGAPTDGSAWSDGDCRQRVLKGGSWFSQPNFVRYAFRNHLNSNTRASTLGFRIARTL
ncbi:hypothetical protein GCM10007895_21540 [Paraferrimonas sedimenticola]|uniref:non-specific serine/threonine protein kinase n=2 Tax=Paraferrimonas sedimenticola TaxID=375674 RepID=A0AA37RXI8_9GAMM|nr:hypothetical protein GCM10007895_21540 [Paraferrimonas sedimenticola]